MSVRRFISNGPRETIEIGGEIARMLSSPTLLFLRGDLGAGKTTLGNFSPHSTNRMASSVARSSRPMVSS